MVEDAGHDPATSRCKRDMFPTIPIPHRSYIYRYDLSSIIFGAGSRYRAGLLKLGRLACIYKHLTRI